MGDPRKTAIGILIGKMKPSDPSNNEPSDESMGEHNSARDCMDTLIKAIHDGDTLTAMHHFELMHIYAHQEMDKAALEEESSETPEDEAKEDPSY